MNNGIDPNNSRTRTAEYAAKNADVCGNALLKELHNGNDCLENGVYGLAAESFERVVTGLRLLAEVDPELYGAPLYANQYALSRIYLLGLENLPKGTRFLKAACAQAEKCVAYNDLKVMADVLAVLEKSGINGVLREFDISLP